MITGAYWRPYRSIRSPFTSQARYIEIAASLHQQGAEGVILGCTEICMLLYEQVTDVPLIDTTGIHAEAAVQWMLS